jgi:lipoate-protein ligase A
VEAVPGEGVVGPWRVSRSTGSAAEFHARQVPDAAVREVWFFDIDAPALVLGSTQSDSAVDRAAAARAGVNVVRRRSGGGAVLLTRHDVLWVDVVLPAGDALWVDDLGTAAHWLGNAWATALAGTGVPGATVHRGPLVRTAWSDAVCFAGIGSGEVSVAGRKVVGISQRRTRAWVRFQCAALRRWDPEPLTRFLVPPPPLDALADVAAGTGAALDPLAGALVAALPH